MSTVDKDYIDAKFDGIKDLLEAQGRNLTAFVSAVGMNVKEVRADLAAHKEDTAAHGIGPATAATERRSASVVQWLSLAVSIGALFGVLFPLIHK